jgi:hypothetical protein
VAVPVVSFASSLIPGQSRHIKTAATRYKFILSRIPSRSNIGSPPAPVNQAHTTTLKPHQPSAPVVRQREPLQIHAPGSSPRRSHRKSPAHCPCSGGHLHYHQSYLSPR